jgi:EAL domain-containing protein (putative c-di-GMP-specific phosphodiesterase class I)
MDKLGYWILDTACSDLKKTNEAGFNITLSVNISAKQLESESFLDNLQEIIEKHHLIDRYRFGLALPPKVI